MYESVIDWLGAELSEMRVIVIKHFFAFIGFKDKALLEFAELLVLFYEELLERSFGYSLASCFHFEHIEHFLDEMEFGVKF